MSKRKLDYAKAEKAMFYPLSGGWGVEDFTFDGEAINDELLIDKGIWDPEDEDAPAFEDLLPNYISDFKKIGLKFGKRILSAEEYINSTVGSRHWEVEFNANEKFIALRSDNFIIRDLVSMINMINSQPFVRVMFGRTSDSEHFTKYAMESSAFSAYIDDLFQTYMDCLDTLTEMYICFDEDNTLVLVLQDN